MTTLSVDGRWYAGEMIYKRDGHFKFDSTELFDAYAVVQVLYPAPLVYALNLYYQRFWGVNTPNFEHGLQASRSSYGFAVLLIKNVKWFWH